jgi:hypothetical protein
MEKRANTYLGTGNNSSMAKQIGQGVLLNTIEEILKR